MVRGAAWCTHIHTSGGGGSITLRYLYLLSGFADWPLLEGTPR